MEVFCDRVPLAPLRGDLGGTEGATRCASALVCLPGSVVGVVDVESALLLATDARVAKVTEAEEETCC